MITDVQNQFMNTTVATGAPATNLGQFSYDLWGGQTAQPSDALGNVLTIDPAVGKPLEVVFVVTATLTSAGAATIQFQLITSTDVANTVSVVVVATTEAIALANLTAGYTRRLVMNNQNSPQRYLGIQYVVGTAAFTGGSLSANVVLDGAAMNPPNAL